MPLVRQVFDDVPVLTDDADRITGRRGLERGAAHCCRVVNASGPRRVSAGPAGQVRPCGRSRSMACTRSSIAPDAWGATLGGPAECPPPASPALGWDGCARVGDARQRRRALSLTGIRETSPAVTSRVHRAFWNAPGPTTSASARATRARRVAAPARDTAVAGYDVMNRPNASATPDAAGLADYLRRRAAREIHPARRDGRLSASGRVQTVGAVVRDRTRRAAGPRATTTSSTVPASTGSIKRRSTLTATAS